jgi:CheY-like chemotaxis protein
MAHVLIVEDAYDGTEALATFLRKSGHEVTLAGNGREALVAVIQSEPDVVLLDLLMPELDGPTFLEIIRSYLRMYSLPIVVLTGLPDSPMIGRIRRLKVNSILVKGRASLDDIRKAVEEAVGRMAT